MSRTFSCCGCEIALDFPATHMRHNRSESHQSRCPANIAANFFRAAWSAMHSLTGFLWAWQERQARMTAGQ